MKTNRFKSWFGALVLPLALAACGGGGGGGSSTPTGTLSVALTDAPACGFEQVNVTVSKVRVHRSDSASENDPGWSEIPLNPARKIDLLSLNNGVLLELGQTPLPAGHYTQLRLVLVPNSTGQPLANSVVPSSTRTEVAVDTPSAVQTGIKLIHEFDVAAGQRVDLVLDFDACKSIVQRGNGTFLLKPVVKVIPTALNGINGFVDVSVPISNVRVTAQQGGVVIGGTTPTQTGEFFIARLAPGSYDVVITADGRATAVIKSVPVQASAITMVSTNAAPIGLNTSGTSTVSGDLTPDSAETTVRALQTLTGGPRVEVHSVLVTGRYSMTLPIAAPFVGSFGAGTLPIALTPDMVVAGKYTVEASAPGLTTQSDAVDVSGGNVDRDITLTP